MFSYVNHLGEFINFYGDSPYILTSHSFMDWQLTYDTTANRSSGFRIEGKEIPFTVRIMPRRVKGKDRHQAFSQLINRFAAVVAADIEQPGRLYAQSGEFLEGRIIVSQKTDWNIDKSVTLNCQLRVDDPVWTNPNTHNISFNPETTYKYLGYPHGYSYDYAATLKGYQTLRNASTEPADYILNIHGPCVSPMVSINGVKVGAYVVLGADDRLVIDTRTKSVIKQTANMAINAFNSRYKGDTSMFAQIPPGAVTVIWSGVFDFDLTILEKRREPAWMI